MKLTSTQLQGLRALLADAEQAKAASRRRRRKSPVRDALLLILKTGPKTRRELLVHFPEHRPHDLSMALNYAKDAGYIRRVPPMRWELVPESERDSSPLPAPKPVGRPRSTAFVGQVKNAKGEWVPL